MISGSRKSWLDSNGVELQWFVAKRGSGLLGGQTRLLRQCVRLAV